jgi:DNA-binding response OmpR family regulator
MERNRGAVLVAEADPKDARQLVSYLLTMDLDVYLAISLEEVFRWLHRRVFQRAIVAAELTIGGEILIARLAHLPAIRCLIAVGPAGDMEMEARCREAGAKAYLGRPVTPEILATLLGVPARRMRDHKADTMENS